MEQDHKEDQLRDPQDLLLQDLRDLQQVDKTTNLHYTFQTSIIEILVFFVSSIMKKNTRTV